MGPRRKTTSNVVCTIGYFLPYMMSQQLETRSMCLWLWMVETTKTKYIKPWPIRNPLWQHQPLKVTYDMNSNRDGQWRTHNLGTDCIAQTSIVDNRVVNHAINTGIFHHLYSQSWQENPHSLFTVLYTIIAMTPDLLNIFRV